MSPATPLYASRSSTERTARRPTANDPRASRGRARTVTHPGGVSSCSRAFPSPRTQPDTCRVGPNTRSGSSSVSAPRSKSFEPSLNFVHHHRAGEQPPALHAEHAHRSGALGRVEDDPHVAHAGRPRGPTPPSRRTAPASARRGAARCSRTGRRPRRGTAPAASPATRRGSPTSVRPSSRSSTPDDRRARPAPARRSRRSRGSSRVARRERLRTSGCADRGRGRSPVRDAASRACTSAPRQPAPRTPLVPALRRLPAARRRAGNGRAAGRSPPSARPASPSRRRRRDMPADRPAAAGARLEASGVAML